MKIKPETKDRILRAADALASEGIDNPTNDQVREWLGGGSLSHISPVMRDWREARKAQASAAFEIPVELKKSIEASVGQVWTSATRIASAAVETAQQEAKEAVETITSERDEALAEITRLENRAEALEHAVQECNDSRGLLQSALEVERTRTTELSNNNAALTASRDALAEQLAEMKAELKSVRNDNKSLQQELVAIARNSSSPKST